jgi:type IV pilus assembly protein PilY1
MNTTLKKLTATGAGFVWILLASASAQAQDVEIFIGNNNPGNNAKPNILLILDNSLSMAGTVITQNNYDPAVNYSGTCDDDRVYWTTGGNPPACWTSSYIEMANFHCERAMEAFRADQGGTYQDYFAHFDPGSQDRWENLSPSYHTRDVECRDDLPDPASGWAGHGDGSSATEVYPRHGDQNNRWTSNASHASRVIWGTWPTAQQYRVYSGNYLNWYYGAASTSTRLEVMQDVASNIVNSVNGVNIGLMHFNYDEGGEVLHAVEDVATGRTNLLAAINGLNLNGFTPLSETLYEAHQYLRGATPVYGGGSVSAAFDTSGGTTVYNSPIEQSCQKNHIVLLTDGEPTRDSGANGSIVGLVDAAGDSFNDLIGGSCDAESSPADSNGLCLDDLAEFMYDGDISSEPGLQNVITHTVGFLIDLPMLEDTAARGGGEYRTATDTATLTTALTNIVTSILDTQSTFTAPSVSINAFNQTRHLNDIYVGLFRPSSTAHWPGNLKKFKLRASDSQIVDANDLPIIDPVTGVFVDTVQDFWSSTIDGTSVVSGGAAAQLSASRNVYSYFGNSDLTHVTNRIEAANGALTDGVLNTGVAGLPSRLEVIDFINGLDVGDADQDGDITEAHNQIGDPLHSRPVVVVYGPDTDDALVFMGTNDGYLHAFDVADGSEVWSFLPPEFLDQQVDLLVDNSSANKLYGPDGSIRVQMIADADGVIEEADGERVYLFFGMRRGGDAYYALDITDPDSPEVLWHKDSSDLPGMGQSWSSTTPTRINIQGATQNTNKLALVIGGGYDASQDASAHSTDATGNSIYIVDTVSGDLLWHGTNSGGTQDFSDADWSMDYSIPADVRVLDLNGDGFADRMYAGDMGGQIWRFDIENGKPASELVAGGVIAQLGAAGLASPSVADTRRFYYAPDVALVINNDYNYVHIGIGSGHRAHPNATVNHDEFYALRDYWTYAPKTQGEYNDNIAFPLITVGDLVDVTTDTSASVPQGSPGWRMSLNDGGWLGEKVLAESRVFDGRVFVSTYRPGTNGVSCEPALGTTRQYVMSVFNASPVTNLDGSVEDYNGDGIVDPQDLQLTDRYREFQGPPPPETVFFFPGPEGDVDGDGDVDADDGFSLSCVATNTCLDETPCQGLRCFPNGVERFPVRTFWSQDDIE